MGKEKKKRGKRVLACLLSLALVSFPVMPSPEIVYAAEPAMTELPGTTKVEKEYDETFLSVTGFGAKGVQDRTCYYEEYAANGYQDTKNYVVVDEDCYMDKERKRISAAEYEALEEEKKGGYKFVTSEEQFCYGMVYARVVEIRADLELGFKWLEENDINTYGAIEPVSDYEKGFAPITSPVLMKVGVSSINTKSHMTIFSPNGATLNHGCFDNNNVSDVVIRNLSIQGNYEWDDMPEGQQVANTGNNKRYGWSNISNKNAHGIWIDHCTTGISFDGNIDNKNASQVTISWCEIGKQDISQEGYENTELGQCIQYMEGLYQKGEGYHLYTKYRKEGMTPYDIFKKAAQHKKVSIVSAGPDDYDDNPLDAVTIAYCHYTNAGSRVPAGMQCNAHMFNAWISNDDYVDMKRCMNPHQGASMGADTCVFDGVSGAVLGDEVSDGHGDGSNAGYKKFIGAVTYQLIVNSKIRLPGSSDWYTGSSWDNNGVNNFTKQWNWSGRSDSYVKTKTFKWSEWVPVYKELNEVKEGGVYLSEGDASLLPNGEYYKKYYIGRDELGYDYQTFPLEDVEKNLAMYAGAGKIRLDNAGEWCRLYYGLDENTCQVTFDEQEGTMTPDTRTVLYQSGEVLGNLPKAARKHYNFLGWYAGKYEIVNDIWQLTLSEEPVTAETRVTEDMRLFPKWEEILYTVVFDSMGGSSMEGTGYTDVHGGTAIRNLGGFPADPVKEGAVFLGWYAFDSDTQTFGTRYLVNTAVDSNMILYAKWNNTINFDTDGGTEITSKKVESGKTIGTVANPEKERFTFAGWFTDEERTKLFDVKNDKVMEPMTLYAKWEEGSQEKEKVQLVLVVDEETEPQTAEVERGATPAAIYVPEKPEYVFEGWYTDSEKKEPLSADMVFEENTTLYAAWGLKGDVNDDGRIDTDDALAVLKNAVRIEQEVFFAERAECDGQAGITTDDALFVLKRAIGVLESFDFQQDMIL